MPITKSAKKAHRVSLRKRVFNAKRKRNMKDSVKDLRKLIVGKDKAGAEAKLSEAYQAIDKAAKRGIIKPNTASRKKSRLAQAIGKIEK
ncbi:MAG TPA: 30S ribosomal protein S20 [Candidatus Paceibacterota bacterium]|nr:30S ribosomal protein S20 [Candidatus Paceibacterota bacterium]